MSLLWFALVGLIAVVIVATAGLGLAYAARAQAQVASDAAALAAAVATYPPAVEGGSPASRARLVASDNGATLVSCLCPVDRTLEKRTVTVVAQVIADVPMLGELRVRAASKAEFDPRRWLGR